MTVIRRLVLASLTCFVIAQVGVAAAQEFNGRPARSAHAESTGRLIVKWREPAKQSHDAETRARKATSIAGLELRAVSAAPGSFEVLQIVAGAPTTSALNDAAGALERSGEVEYASIEYRRKAHALTSDPLLAEQWYLLSAQPAATRTDAAWDVTTSNASIVIAVLDTGVLFDHPDLGAVATGGKLLPGYDFIANVPTANDGNGRDPNPSDPGDWVTTTEATQPPFTSDCLSEGQAVDSSWHGTRVAGLVAARTNNALGIAGSAYDTLVLPVRVLGKCGGVDADIIDAMRWAAGLSVGSLPINPNPARVINLSLGGEGPCTSAYQSAVNDVIAAGALVVASAGNEGGPVSAPANCAGVLGVAGLRHIGTKVGFSNLGPEIGIGAPGGNCVNVNGGPCLYSIVVTSNSGATTPASHIYTDQLNFNVGTSFSSPMVASAAGLLRAVNGSLTPAQIVLLLQDTASPYPTSSAVAACTVPTSGSAPQDAECNCTRDTCGAGMLNTGAALAAVQKPLAVIETSGSLAVGATLVVNGGKSFAGAGRTLASHQWSVADVVGTQPALTNSTSASASVQLSGAAQFTLRLTVTDDQGTTDAKYVPIATEAPQPVPVPTPTPAPSPIVSGGGGGGGGALGLELVALLALGGLARRRR